MSLHPLFGHQLARRQASEAIRSGRFPQVTLVTGPAGIGKQRFALWLSQLLLCDKAGDSPGTDPGQSPDCPSCRLVLDLGHPDLHWFVPIPRPKAGEPDRQVEEASDLQIEAISARRENPLYQASDGMAFHPLASVRLLLRRAALTPVQGGRKIFVLGEADRLVPQESSPEAANALLKLLEEPPFDTWVILTTTEAERVLPTIRSRVVPIRLSRLPDSEVRAFIQTVLQPHGVVPTEDLIRQAAGAIGKLAGRAAQAGGEPAKAVAEARAVLQAVAAGPGEQFERALRQPPWSARGGFTDLLDALAAELMEQAKRSSDPEKVRSLTQALDRIETAREAAQGNVNPQLILADLTAELAEVM